MIPFCLSVSERGRSEWARGSRPGSACNSWRYHCDYRCRRLHTALLRRRACSATRPSQARHVARDVCAETSFRDICKRRDSGPEGDRGSHSNILSLSLTHSRPLSSYFPALSLIFLTPSHYLSLPPSLSPSSPCPRPLMPLFLEEDYVALQQ